MQPSFRRPEFVVAVVGVALLTLTVVILAVGVADSPADDSESGDWSVPDQQIVAAHDAGVTGEDVTVGVVDANGFDADGPPLSGRVTAEREFGHSNEERDAHGTAAAGTVATVAPDAELYLATATDADGYADAISWFVQQDVDVIVAPVSLYDGVGDGNSPSDRATSDAVDAGVTVVAPTGNVAQGHRIITDDETSTRIAGDRREHRSYVSWADPDSNHELALRRVDEDGEGTIVARSERLPGTATSARLTATLRDGPYELEVVGNHSTELRVVSPTHEFDPGSPASSVVSPATAHGTIAVGAADQSGDAEPFSSRGPTADGRIGVDVLAPHGARVPGVTEQFADTSAAAAYAGGTAALVVDAADDPTPREVRWVLRESVGPADDERQAPTPTRGYGVVDPERAVSLAQEDCEG